MTLLELLIVVALIGVAAGGLVLSLGGTTEQARLRAATLELQQAVRQARHLATTRKRPVWLVLQIGGPAWRIVQADASEHPWHRLEGVTIAGASSTGDAQKDTAHRPFTIRFTPTGASVPWEATLRSGRAQRIVRSDGVTGRLAVVNGDHSSGR